MAVLIMLAKPASYKRRIGGRARRIALSSAMRLLGLFILLGLLVVVPFLIWGEGWEALFSGEHAAAWLQGHGSWAWAVGLGLLVADLFLPIPGTAVMSALGYVYGWLLGGLLSAAGSVASGLLAYGLCRAIGRRAAERIAGRKDLEQGQRMFARAGGWVVAWSRWLPVLPEVIACLAGMVRMRFEVFFAALLCGGIPLGFAFAAIGDAGRANPAMALLASALIPPLLWWTIGRRLSQIDASRNDR
jgi:uncharacterized membrane protein YdjX (TVP38/TMEM64 family)